MLDFQSVIIKPCKMKKKKRVNIQYQFHKNYGNQKKNDNRLTQLIMHGILLRVGKEKGRDTQKLSYYCNKFSKGELLQHHTAY